MGGPESTTDTSWLKGCLLAALHMNVLTEAWNQFLEVKITLMVAILSMLKLTAMAWPVLLTTMAKNSIVWSAVNSYMSLVVPVCHNCEGMWTISWN